MTKPFICFLLSASLLATGCGGIGSGPVDFDIKMVLVKGGEFMMGCTPEQVEDCNNNENPAHQVKISSFEIGKTEVTQRQWQAVMGSNPSYIKGDDLPVEQVCWGETSFCPKEYSVEEFIIRLNEITGRNYRLPTEAEWEYAARGGKKSRGYKYSGSNTIDDVAWYGDNSDGKSHETCTKKPNELGLCDMSGNVLEWVMDTIVPYSSEAQTNPFFTSDPDLPRVIRGGGWYYFPEYARVANRGSDRDSTRSFIIGFRVARGTL